MNRLGTVFCAGATMALLGVVAAVAGHEPIIECTGGPCAGTNDAEVLNGTPQRDEMKALRGNDFLNGEGGRDLLNAGPGADVTTGNAGNDTHLGGPGGDSLNEVDSTDPDGDDLMKGGKGADYAGGGAGKDTLVGGRGSDRLVGAPARQRGFGSQSCFRDYCAQLFGDLGNDSIFGGKGRDYIEGEQGRDKMSGGKGADVIDAANDDTPGAKDVVVCGEGIDTVFANPPDIVADDCERVKPPQPVE